MISQLAMFECQRVCILFFFCGPFCLKMISCWKMLEDTIVLIDTTLQPAGSGESGSGYHRKMGDHFINQTLWDFGVEPSIGRWVFTLPGIRR